MNKKIKQVIAIALALVMCAGALLYAPHPVMAAELYPVLSNGFVFSDIDHNGGDWNGFIREFYVSNLESTDAVYALAYYDSSLDFNATKKPQGYYLFSKSKFSFDWTVNLNSNGSSHKDESSTSHYSAVLDNTATLKGYFYPFSCLQTATKITDYPIGYDLSKGDLSAYEVMNIILSGDTLDGIDFGGSSTYQDAVDELGYIQNITTATKNVNLAHANQHSIPVIKFSFSTTTSTGKKIYEEGMDVQYMLTARSFESESDYSQKNVYKSAKSDLFFVSENPNIYDEKNSLNKGFFNFSAASDTWQSMYSDLKYGMSFFANIVYDREFFIRPVYRESIFSPIKYGGWSRVVIDAFGKTHVIEGTIQGGENNPDATPDSDGKLDESNNQYDSDHKIGSGNNESDAESNSKDASDIFGSDFVDSFKDFDLSSLSNILGQLGEAASAFADLIGVVFGWMPTWVRGSLIAAVSIWILMLIKRAIL